jgi:hypothetical protein
VTKVRCFATVLCFLLLLTGCDRADAPLTSQEDGELPDNGMQSAPLEDETPMQELTELLLPEEVQAAEVEPGKEEGAEKAQYSPAEGFAVYPLSPELKKRITGNSWKQNDFLPLEDLRYLKLLHLDFEGNTQTGEMIVHHSLAQEMTDIFLELYQSKYPIHRISLIEEFDCDDMASMEANNTSCFNMRKISGTESWSHHSYGRAVDINPLQNPYVTASGVWPSGEYLERSEARPGMITEGDICFQAFVSRGWTWGGYWSNPDYQHFEKNAGI